MSPEDQAIAERMVAGLTVTRVANHHAVADKRPTASGQARVRAFAKKAHTDDASMAAAQ